MTEPPVLHFKRWCPDPRGVFEELLEYPWRQEHITMYGKTVPEPRKVLWFGPSDLSYTGKKNKAHEMTQLLRDIADYASITIKEKLGMDCYFNGVFANLYETGENYLGWHKDKEKGMTSPIIASVSFGATREFQIRRDSDSKIWRYQLDSGDLLIMHGDCQKYFKHQVPKRKKVTEPRINLTFRVWAT